MNEAFYLSGKEWLLPVALALVVAVGFVLWAYHKAPTDRKTRRICIGLKVLGIVLLLLCLVDPMVTEERAQPEDTMIALFHYDAGEDQQSGEDPAIFDSFPFVRAVDIYRPADPETSITVELNGRRVVMPAWGEGVLLGIL